MSGAAPGEENGATAGASGAIDTESWAFALELYAEPGIADACLVLQNECGVDVMVLLMATFAAVRRGIALTPFDVAAMDAVCRDWRERVVLPLRALRTMLKSGPAPAPNEQSEKLRSSIKAAELSAERLQNELLAQWLAKLPPGACALQRGDIISALRAVIDLALQERQGEPSAAQLSLIGVIADTAFKLSN
ncbi:TIGR02444 family protein [Bradyrhizobium neotropicale]|uniref:TIGR02444 family protein n=1 Tax=Bradyrhizobium neotropicale TaxID=1497615 RepID=UPI001AD7B2D8|nr:TIGR02444 family protein [Bradyrhizobium neotropicale]MBO4221071.1 TIGR02444 family protein [Bradyrhizobium neotropicale]